MLPALDLDTLSPAARSLLENPDWIDQGRVDVVVTT